MQLLAVLKGYQDLNPMPSTSEYLPYIVNRATRVCSSSLPDHDDTALPVKKYVRPSRHVRIALRENA